MDTKTQQAVDIVNQRITNMVLNHPFFSTIVLNLDTRPCPGVGTACTDGTNLLYEPEFILGLSKEQVSGLLAHEAMHVALMHPYRMDRTYHEPRKSNISMDYEINNFLDSYNKAMNRNGDVPFPLPAGGLLDHQYDDLAWEQIYEKLPKNEDGGGQPGQPGNGDEPGQWGKVTTPDDPQGKDGEAKDKDGNPKPGKTRSDWAVIVTKAEQIAKMHGKMPGDFAEMVSKNRRPEIPWHEYLQKFFEAHSSDDFDTRRSDRRYLPHDMYLPSLYSDAMGELVVAVDTSGSIYCDQELFSRFLAEIDDVLSRVKPAKTTLLQCDTRITDVREYRPGEITEQDFSVKGGGGTSFIPVFDWIEKEGSQTKVLVYFTDGMGDFPNHAPGYDVLWVDYGGTNYPFGEVIRTKP